MGLESGIFDSWLVHRLGRRMTLLVTRTLLGTKGIATRSKDATSSSWSYYYSNKDATRNKGDFCCGGIG